MHPADSAFMRAAYDREGRMIIPNWVVHVLVLGSMAFLVALTIGH